MRDYLYTDAETGAVLPISKMPTADILECLSNGIDNAGVEATDAIMDRLRIELVIRELGL